MNKVLLLDFDGVIFKHKSALNIVSNKAARFVKNNIKVNNRDSHIINKYLYKSFGHTVNGLNKIGYNIKVEEYNNYIYNNIDYKRIFNNINEKDIEDIIKIINICKEKQIKLYIFSNSPEIWYKNIMECMNLNMNDFDYINNMNMLKPEKELYNKIENEFTKQIYFVDDSFVNFTHTLLNPKWINIMLDRKTINIDAYGTPNLNLKIIKDLDEIIPIILE